MPVIRSFATVKAGFPTGSWPYIDTPDFSYDQWLIYLNANGQLPIGTVANAPTVAIVGAGVSGLCAAYELSRAGCAVTVFEQATEVGGRCASYLFAKGSTDLAELGSMRFPPSEFILDYYLKNLGLVSGGLNSLPKFPDPGQVNTYLSYEGSQDVWTPNGALPGGFDTVNNGWGALYTNGITINGAVVYEPAAAIAQTLASHDVATATAIWAKYIKRFGQMTFYGALYELFSGKGVGENGVQYDIPGNTPWTFSDFDRFGALGVGSGGFGPLYPIGFTEIFRLLINGLESTQRFLQPSPTLTDGIRSVPDALALATQSFGGEIKLGTPIVAIHQSDPGSGFMLRAKTPPGGIEILGPFDRVIVATTTRAMELTTNVTSYQPQELAQLLSPDVVQAIMRTHVVSSNKVAVRINNFWANDPNAVRCLQTDTLSHQVYTLDYTPVGASPDATGIAFISYVWDDDAVKQQSITHGAPGGVADVGPLFTTLMNSLVAMGGQVGSWAQNLQPLDDVASNVMFEEWQSNPYFSGAFKLSQPGQDTYVQQMFFDYQKARTVNDTGVYLAGDCIAWNSGWVEGGLQTALNAAAGVLYSLGGTLNSYPDPVTQNPLTPLTINASRYAYT
jgi:tryptophan 2-monooxygenase